MINPCGLHIVVGPTGSGKSMFMMQWIGRILAKTDRTIVTNLPINWHGLAEEMKERYDWAGKLEDRIYHTEQYLELKNFWLCFGFGWSAIDIEEDAYELGFRPDYSTVYRYVQKELRAGEPIDRKPLYRMRAGQVRSLLEAGEVEAMDAAKIASTEILIDEAGSVFPQLSKRDNSKHWKLAYTHALEHKRKIRPDGLNVVCACQFANQLDSEIRNQANSWIYLANFAGRRRGIFYLPKRSVWQQYPTQPRDTDKPDLTGHFAISAESWGRTYDTSAGVGLGGGMSADTKAKVGGISWAWFPVIIGVIVLGGILFMKAAPGGITATFRWLLGMAGGKTIEAKAAVGSVTTNAVHQSVGLDAEIAKLRQEFEASKRKEDEKPDRIAVSAVAVVNGVCRFYFFDGSQGSSGDRRFGGLILDGKRVRAVRWEGREYEIKDKAAHERERKAGDHWSPMPNRETASRSSQAWNGFRP